MRIRPVVLVALFAAVPIGAIHPPFPGRPQPHETRIDLDQDETAWAGQPDWQPQGGPGKPGYERAYGIDLDPHDYPPGTRFVLHLATGEGRGWRVCWRLFDATVHQPVSGSQACHIRHDSGGWMAWFVDDLPVRLAPACHTYYVQELSTAVSASPDSTNPRIMRTELIARWRE